MDEDSLSCVGFSVICFIVNRYMYLLSKVNNKVKVGVLIKCRLKINYLQKRHYKTNRKYLF